MGDTHDYKYISVPANPISVKTLLWENTNISAGMANGANIYITQQNSSYRMSQFTHLEIGWWYSTTYYLQSGSTLTGSIMIEVSYMKQCIEDNNAPRLVLGGYNKNDGMNYARCIRYGGNDTTLVCYNGVRCWGTGTPQANNAWMVPAYVKGVKLS